MSSSPSIAIAIAHAKKSFGRTQALEGVNLQILLRRVFEDAKTPGAQQLTQWLAGLGVSPRDLRTSSSGREHLSLELGSARSRNFIGSPTVAA